jgi:hypothetical protein
MIKAKTTTIRMRAVPGAKKKLVNIVAIDVREQITVIESAKKPIGPSINSSARISPAKMQQPEEHRPRQANQRVVCVALAEVEQLNLRKLNVARIGYVMTWRIMCSCLTSSTLVIVITSAIQRVHNITLRSTLANLKLAKSVQK